VQRQDPQLGVDLRVVGHRHEQALVQLEGSVYLTALHVGLGTLEDLGKRQGSSSVSKQPQHFRATHLGSGQPHNLNNLFINRIFRADVQISTFIQGNPANGLCLDLGKFSPEVSFYKFRLQCVQASLSSGFIGFERQIEQ